MRRREGGGQRSEIEVEEVPGAGCLEINKNSVLSISAELFVSQERLRSQLANSLTSVNRSISRQSSGGSVQNKVSIFVRSCTETTRAQLNSLSLS